MQRNPHRTERAVAGVRGQRHEVSKFGGYVPRSPDAHFQQPNVAAVASKRSSLTGSLPSDSTSWTTSSLAAQEGAWPMFAHSPTPRSSKSMNDAARREQGGAAPYPSMQLKLPSNEAGTAEAAGKPSARSQRASSPKLTGRSNSTEAGVTDAAGMASSARSPHASSPKLTGRSNPTESQRNGGESSKRPASPAGSARSARSGVAGDDCRGRLSGRDTSDHGHWTSSSSRPLMVASMPAAGARPRPRHIGTGPAIFR